MRMHVQWNDAGLRSYGRLLEELAESTGRDMPTVVRTGAKYLGKAAIDATPIMRKNKARVVAVASLAPWMRDSLRSRGVNGSR